MDHSGVGYWLDNFPLFGELYVDGDPIFGEAIFQLCCHGTMYPKMLPKFFIKLAFYAYNNTSYYIAGHGRSR